MFTKNFVLFFCQIWGRNLYKHVTYTQINTVSCKQWPTTLITTQALLSLVLRLLLSKLPNSLLFFPASDDKIKLISVQ